VAKRSPILGYNHNVRHRGLLFHVQTEDSGVDNPHIFTHLFHGGVIIASRKLEYDRESAEEVVKALMQAQHKASLKALKAGTFDDKISSYLADQPGLEPAPARRRGRETLESMAPPQPHGQVVTPAPTPIRPPEPPPLTPLGEGSARGSQHPVESEMRATAPSQTRRTDDVSAAFRLIKREPTEPAAQPDVMSMPVAPVVAKQRPGSQTGYSLHRTGQLELMPEIHDQPTAPIARGKGRVASAAPVAPRPPQPAARPVGKAATHAPPRPPSRADSTDPVSRGAVVVSRPPVIVGAPARLGPRDVHPPAPRTIRRARESTRPSLFGKDLISERSLDEVILAYLSEDAAEK
jgi:hypothetical protein